MISIAEVRRILDTVKAEGRTSLTAPEGKIVCEAYGIAVPKEGVAASAAAAAKILKGVRGADPVNRDALAKTIQNVSQLVADYPEIAEMDLNPVFATRDGAIAADVRIVVNFSPVPARYRPKHEDIVRDMNRIMKPKAVAVIGASSEAGKIGNSVMKNLINGGYKGQVYPINPSTDEIMGLKAYKSVMDVHADIDVAVFAIPAKFVAGAIAECGEKRIPGAVLIPSGFAEVGNVAGQQEI